MPGIPWGSWSGKLPISSQEMAVFGQTQNNTWLPRKLIHAFTHNHRQAGTSMRPHTCTQSKTNAHTISGTDGHNRPIVGRTNNGIYVAHVIVVTRYFKISRHSTEKHLPPKNKLEKIPTDNSLIVAPCLPSLARVRLDRRDKQSRKVFYAVSSCGNACSDCNKCHTIL